MIGMIAESARREKGVPDIENMSTFRTLGKGYVKLQN